jgi:hypothetical protein
MRLDHVSYATSHDQLVDTVQRLGARLGSTFVDGGIHPRFGTRNFTCALKNGQYIEVVCPLDHPANEQTPWGKLYQRKPMKVAAGSLGFSARETLLRLQQSSVVKQSKVIAHALMVQILSGSKLA